MKRIKKLSSMALALAMTLSTGLTPITYASVVKYGDCNGDSVVNKLDSAALKAYLLGTGTINFEASDVNQDNKANISDYIILLKFINGTISGLPYVNGQVVVITPTESDTIYVSPTGQDSASGTVANPTSFVSALTKVVAGGTIYMTPGTYSYSTQITIARGNDGTSAKPKNIKAYGTGKVILDFSSQTYVDPATGSNPRGLQIDGNYWNIKGINAKGSADNGIYIGGSNNKIELCETYDNRDTGLQLGRYISTALDSEWPSNNLILNCTSYDNSDPDNGEDADGFACKLTTGIGNVFDGCISHNNVDDGWDLYAKVATGPIGPVTIKNCVAYNNGVTSAGASTANSDGNGFKLGGDKIAVNHMVSNSVAFNNKKHGFTYNSNPGSISITNCTGYNNGITSGSNFAFDLGTHVFTNLLSLKATSSDKISGTDVDKSNVWWISQKTTNAKGLACSAADFVSLTPSIGRNTDGSVNLGDFLKLATGSDMIKAGTPSGTNIGATLSGSLITPPVDPISYPTPTLTSSTTAANASSVTVTVGNFGTAAIKQYKIDNGSWINYTVPVVISSNCTVYAQGSDSLGNKSAIASVVISNIGTVVPVTYSTPTLTPSTTAANASSVAVTVGNFGTAAIKQYKIDNGSWINYTAPVIVSSNCTVYAQGSDSLGNKSTIASLVVSNIGTVTQPIDPNAIYVGATSGKTLAQAITLAKSGNTIIVQGTITAGATTIPSGVTLKGETGAKINFAGASKGIVISGTGVTVSDLEIYGSGDNGVYITGNGNKIINCVIHDNADSGVQLSNGAANNLIQLVYSHHNVDATGGNADGFACKLGSGEGNVFDRCNAEGNSDDGYDLYAAHGAVTFISCIAKNNGECYGKVGNGSGFKVGGVDNKTAGVAAHLDPLKHTLTDCIAEGNRVGFDRNNQNGVVTMTRCIATANTEKDYNFPLSGTPSALGYLVTFGIANIDSCTSSTGKNNITGAVLIGTCKGF